MRKDAGSVPEISAEPSDECDPHATPPVARLGSGLLSHLEAIDRPSVSGLLQEAGLQYDRVAATATLNGFLIVLDQANVLESRSPL